MPEIIRRNPRWEEAAKERGNSMKTVEILNIETIGIKASGFERRSVNDCLNCQKPECDGCVSDKGKRSHEYYLRWKERGKTLGGCIYCGGKTIARKCKTINDGIVMREKQCKECGKIFYSAEVPCDHEQYLKIMMEHK